jgi:predicted NBD/HSP70 family sugar kinase
MDHYAGIDVSLEFSSVCIVDTKGKIVKEAKVPSDPDALVAPTTDGSKRPATETRKPVHQRRARCGAKRWALTPCAIDWGS